MLIKRLGAAILLIAWPLLCLSLPAHAQNANGGAYVVASCGTPPNGFGISGSGYVAGAWYPVTQDTTGKVCSSGGGGSGAPYVFTPLGFVQVTSFSTSTGFTCPAGATYAVVQSEGASVRFRDDGTNPTATIGQLMAVTSPWQFSEPFTNLKFIPTTGSATLDVGCYK